MNAVVIVAIDRASMLELCLRGVEPYCDRYGLALEIVTTPEYRIPGDGSYNFGTFEKFQVHRFVDQYDRILRLDVDTIVAPSCPNVFSLVPPEAVGVVHEDIGPKARHRRSQIRLAKKALGNARGWRKGYFNSGVVVSSREHGAIYDLTSSEIEIATSRDLGPYKEQTLLNWKLRHERYQVESLDHRFNHLSLHTKMGWDPRQSYIIHVAGRQDEKMQAMQYYADHFFGKT